MMYQAIIVGAGVIGCAVARALAARRPSWKILVLEKEPDVARHTSGRNSGVIHSGFNAAPGTLKARFCVEGNRRLREYCRTRNVTMLEVGTVVVAVEPEDELTLAELERRGRENGVPGITLIDHERLKTLEPHTAGRISAAGAPSADVSDAGRISRSAALFSPTGSIVDSTGVVRAYASEARDAGVEFSFFKKVRSVEPGGAGFWIQTDVDRHESVFFINCAGLYADQIAHQLGVAPDLRIFPFRGDYFRLVGDKSHLVRSMIYPAPNIKYPFLGIHFTKKVTGEVLVGPNAVLAFGRESYTPLDIQWTETVQMILTRHFWNMISGPDFRSLALDQLKTTLFKRAFLNGARRLLPDLGPRDFVRAQSGNRAQLVNSRGELVEDLVLERSGRSIHVLNAVSPGLTCSLPFADYVVDELLKNE